jgi:hypothetical protein
MPTDGSANNRDAAQGGSFFFVPVPSSWYSKSDNEEMTFDDALKALDSDEHKKAIALMEQIDKQLGIEAELSSGVNESPDGVCVVIMHDIKTPVDREELRYIAAVKGKALLENSPHQPSV